MADQETHPLLRELRGPGGTDRYTRSRVRSYVEWLRDTHRHWALPELDTYRDFLLYERRLAPSTVAAYLSGVRSQYRALLGAGAFRLLDDLLAEALQDRHFRDARDALLGPRRGDTEARQTADQDDFDQAPYDQVYELREFIESQIAAGSPSSSDDGDALSATRENLVLSEDELLELIDAANNIGLLGRRDTAMIGLMAATGVTPTELTALEVSDLLHKFRGADALHVPACEGCSDRLVPYGSLRWGLILAQAWLTEAGIEEGPLFRGFYRGSHSLRDTGLSPQALPGIIARYPIEVDGIPTTVRPVDLRRTYVHILLRSGMDLRAVADNLGLQDLNAVAAFLHPVDPARRIPETELRELSSYGRLIDRALGHRTP